MNKRYWMKEKKAVTIRDDSTLKELKNFVRYPNGTWKARPGVDIFDDEVMALVWALIVLDNELVEKYFIVEKYDENKRPLVVRSFSSNKQTQINSFDSLYYGMNNASQGLPAPFVFTSNESPNGDIEELQAMGWKFFERPSV
jgi:hypothetical protein